jgi:hypothetical protein
MRAPTVRQLGMGYRAESLVISYEVVPQSLAPYRNRAGSVYTTIAIEYASILLTASHCCCV